MRRIEIKIRLNVPESSAILNDISRLIERYLKRNKIEFHSIDASVKFDDDEYRYSHRICQKNERAKALFLSLFSGNYFRKVFDNDFENL